VPGVVLKFIITAPLSKTEWPAGRQRSLPSGRAFCWPLHFCLFWDANAR